MLLDSMITQPAPHAWTWKFSSRLITQPTHSHNLLKIWEEGGEMILLVNGDSMFYFIKICCSWLFSFCYFKSLHCPFSCQHKRMLDTQRIQKTSCSLKGTPNQKRGMWHTKGDGMKMSETLTLVISYCWTLLFK